MPNELTNYDKQYAEMAAQYAAQHPQGGGQFLSTRSGVLSFQDEEMPGNQIAVVILDSVLENTYYGSRFDPDNPAAPVCYAFGRRKDEMAPHQSMAAHPDVFIPQHEDCAGCPQNVFGSADTGRGKACQNRARLALIPAGQYVKGKGGLELDLIDDPEHYKLADIVFLKLSPTSVGEEWTKYIAMLAQQFRRPPLAFVTRIWIAAHPKHQFHVKFEMLEPLKDDLAPIIMARHQQAAASIIQPYAPPQEKPEGQSGRQGLRGLRR